MKLKVIIVILCFFLLSGCSTQSKSKYIFNELGISIPKDFEINYVDTHSGFHGDGTMYATIKVKDKVADKLYAEITESNSWRKLPLSENIQLIMYGGIIKNTIYNYMLADEVGMPKVVNGYYIFIDRFENKNTINEDTQLFGRNSFNFTLAIYDIDNNILYYYEIDT